MESVIVLLSIVLIIFVCVELYTMHKSIERLVEELSSLRKFIRGDVKNRDYLANRLQEKENECFELRERLKWKSQVELINSTNIKKEGGEG